MWIFRALIRISLTSALLASGSAFALDPDLHLAQYQHTSWKAADGAPRGIVSAAQTPDGFLWIGAEQGLFRFDGRNFDPVEELGGTHWARTKEVLVAVDAKGVLWIAAGNAIFRYDGSHVEAIESTRNLRNVSNLFVDLSGRAWVVADHHLWVVEHDQTRQLGKADGFTDRGIFDARLDASGNIHAVPLGGEESNWILRPGKQQWEMSPFPVCGAPSGARDGSIWCGGTGSLRLIRDLGLPTASIKTISTEGHGQKMIDRDGGLWLQTSGGLRHVGHPGAGTTQADLDQSTENMRGADGLTSDIVVDIVEGRDGTVWVLTSKGLDRFREGRFTPVFTREKLIGGSLAAAPGGAVYAAGWRTKTRLVSVSGTSVEVDGGEGAQAITSAPDGGVVIGGADLQRIVDGKITPIDRPPWLKDAIISAVAYDSEGRLWATTGLPDISAVRRLDGTWIHPPVEEGFPEHWRANAMSRDAHGGLLISVGTGFVRWDGRHAVRTSLAVHKFGYVTSLNERGEHLWISAAIGLAVKVKDQVIRIRDPQQHDVEGILQTIELDNGDLWITATSGIRRIRAADLRRAIARGDGITPMDSFDETDGLRGVPLSGWGATPMIQATDGRLWFATDSGLATIDPKKERERSAPPVPFFRRLLADRAPVALSGPTIDPNPEQIEVHFASVAPQGAERLHYRYRLEDVNASWQEAGQRAEAIYSRLPAGSYRLLVQAAVDRGPWSESGTFVFRVRPAWYQTIAFELAIAACVLAALFGIYRLRLRQVTARMRGILEVRQSERDRIAQDLHDTLLQTIYAALLRFDSLGKKLARDDVVRAGIESELDRLENVIDETRGHVSDMRSTGTDVVRWTADVRSHGEAVCAAHGMSFSMEIVGEPRMPDPAQSHDLRGIAREAITNASRHSKGHQVRVVVRADGDRVVISIDDDGIGIGDASTSLGKPGHWGLVGMRERAARLGARLTIEPGEALGTHVELVFPANAIRTGILRRRA